MMKKLLMILVFAISANVVLAQSDTLLYENFDVDPTANYLPFNSGNDIQWVNFDADALPDANARPQEWFWSEVGFSTIDSADACLYSSSWLASFLPGNRNWLMTPPLQIVDASAVLSWESAPRQTPLYVDGYTVLISTTDNIEASFTDTLFQAGQYLTGAGNDFAAYTFSPGFVHGADGTFIEYDNAADSSRFVGVLRPFTASLAQYSGQTIYIAFLHDADDDNLVSLDDILVTGTAVGLNEVKNELGLSLYPNPSSSNIELTYTLAAKSSVVADVYDMRGSKVLSFNNGMQSVGAQKITVDVSELSSGVYNIVLNAAGTIVTTKFVKQ